VTALPDAADRLVAALRDGQWHSPDDVAATLRALGLTTAQGHRLLRDLCRQRRLEREASEADGYPRMRFRVPVGGAAHSGRSGVEREIETKGRKE
jgi:hypothetical protein